MRWFLVDRLLLAIGRLLLAVIIYLTLYKLLPDAHFPIEFANTLTYEEIKEIKEQLMVAPDYQWWLIVHFSCLWVFVLYLRRWMQPLQRLVEQQARLERLSTRGYAPFHG